MRFVDPLIPGVFLRREKRFLAEVALDGDRRIWAHVPNTGALTGCLTPARKSSLPKSPAPSQDHLYLALCPGRAGWVCVDTLVPNRLVAEALAGRRLPDLPRPAGSTAEVTLPSGSRPGFCGWIWMGSLLFIEVKSVTWVEDGVALFPDGVTRRGRRHLEHWQGWWPGVTRPGRSLWCSARTPGGLPARRRHRSGLCPGTGQPPRPRREDHGHPGKNRPPGNYPCRHPPL